MIIQINTDSNITVNGEMAEQIRNQVRDSLERYGDRITRVEAHLSDENSNKKFGTEDKRCLLEVRLGGLKPIAVSHQAETVEQAMNGALDQLKNLIDTTLGKLDKR